MSAVSGPPWEFAVGDGARLRIGRAVLGSMFVAVVFVGFTWTAKELRVLYLHEPWQDDPYDAVVSFSIWCVPLLAAACTLRIALCRRQAALPVRRAYDLLRASRALVAIVLVTLASDWASVVLHAHRSTWTATTAALIGALAVITALTVAVSRELRRAGREPIRPGDTPSQPDWLADALVLGEREAARLGPWRNEALGALRWLDRQLVARIRRRPLRASAIGSLALSGVVASPQLVEEAYAPKLAVFVLAATACGMFAFLVVAGSHLRVVGRPNAPPGRAASAFVLACASVPLTVAFRGSLWWVLATSDRDAGLDQLIVLTIVVAIATSTLAIVTQPLARGHRGAKRFAGS